MTDNGTGDVNWRAFGQKRTQHVNVEGVCLSSEVFRGWAMDIPNDLNKLLAQFKQVTSGTGRVSESSVSSGSRPTASEIELFLRQHNFEPDAAVEQIEISNDGAFEFYMFSVSGRSGDDLSLLAMWPEQSVPTDTGEPSRNSE